MNGHLSEDNNGHVQWSGTDGQSLSIETVCPLGVRTQQQEAHRDGVRRAVETFLTNRRERLKRRTQLRQHHVRKAGWKA